MKTSAETAHSDEKSSRDFMIKIKISKDFQETLEKESADSDNKLQMLKKDYKMLKK